MKQIKAFITASLIIASTSVASANCLNRPSTGMLADTKAPSSVAVKVVKAPVVSSANGSR